MPGVDLGSATLVTWPLGITALTAVLTVRLPDGTTATPAVAETAGGNYSATVATPQAGRYLLSWSKAAAPATTYVEILDVWPADPRFLISLEDGRQQLNWTLTDDDADLRLYIAACTPVIEDIVGAVLQSTEIQYADGGKTGVALWQRPVLDEDRQVTELVVDGVVSTDYVVDENAAIVYAGSSTAPSRFPSGRQNIKITYVAGSNLIGPNIRLATRELLRHLWAIGRQANRPAFGDEPLDTVHTPSGFAVPKRVIELCQANPSLPGIA